MRASRIFEITALFALIVILSSTRVSASVPGAYIIGKVLDEDGKPIPFANVSLWQDGHLWEQTSYLYSNGSTQTSRMPYDYQYNTPGEGGFGFGYVYPGDYTLMAEKDGYYGTTNVTVNSNTTTKFVVNPIPIYANITLKGYHKPTLTPEQQAYTGAIAGNIWTQHGYRATLVTVTLLEDGQFVNTLDNPQGSSPRNYSGVEVDYLFDHLAPGNYTVRAENDAGLYINDSIGVNVNTRPMRADMVLTMLKAPPYDMPDVSISPTVGQFSTNTGRHQSPGILWLIVPVVIGSVAYMIQKRRGSI